MYLLMRSARVHLGREAEALRWAEELARLYRRTTGGEARVYVETFGAVGTVYLMDEYKDLATVERTLAALAEDGEYLAHLARGAEVLVPGTRQDQLLRLAAPRVPPASTPPATG